MLRFVRAASFWACVLAASIAGASPSFPPAIQDHLGLSCQPDCTTCHTRPEGGLGTARQRFGTAMQSAGLTAGRAQKIPAALDELASEQSDVDGDGTPDIDELKNLTNPNAAGEPLQCHDDASGKDDGGCSVGTAHASGLSGAAVVAIAALGVVRAVRRRRR